MSQKVLERFQESTAKLDAMIHLLETNLGKNHSVSPFDAIRAKYGGAKAQAAAAPKEEQKASAAPADKAPAQKKEKKEKKEKQPKGGKAPAASTGPALSAELEFFNNSDLRVGRIVSAEVNECSDKLYFEKIDLGEGHLRDIGSGLQKFVTLEEMTREGSLCVVYANLKPRKLAHIQSHGMVMCASNADHTAIEIVRPPAGSKVGERVNLEGNPIGDAFSQEWQKQLNPKKKIMEGFLGFTKTNDAGEAIYNGARWSTSAGTFIPSGIKNGNVS